MSNLNEMKSMVDFLNHLLSLDKESITSLFNKRVITHEKRIINHPKVQVAQAVRSTYTKDGEMLQKKPFHQLGFLGILNGAYFDGEHFIAAVYDTESKNPELIQYFDIINLKELKKDE